MARSSGTYTAPSNSFNPAVEGTTIDETDWNTLLDDLEVALTDSAYTAGLGSTDNQLVRTDGTDTKKVQGTGITVDDSNNVSGVAALTVTTVNVGNADTTLARSGAGDITVEGNAIYRAGGTDVPIADGGTGASTATTAFNALSPLTTQGDILYHNGTNNVRLGPGTAGQVLQSGGAGANPSWSAAGSGDVAGPAASVDSEIALFDSTTGKLIKRATTTGLLKGASGVLSAAVAGTDYYNPGGTDVAVADGGTGASTAGGAATNLGLGTGDSPQFTAINIGHATDTTIARSGAGDITVEGNAVYRAGGTDVAIADGGTGASTAAAGFRALAEGVGSTQGQLLYRDGTQWTALSAGTSGQVLQTGGAGANPAWATVAGTGDVTAASSFGTDNRVVRSDGTGKGVQSTGVTVDDSDNVTGVVTLNGSVIPISLPAGRLTLTTLTPVMTATASAQTTIYYTPYVGNQVPIYDGTRFVVASFAELSQTTTDTTKSPAACTTNSNYDLFVWSDGGTIRCTRGPAWTSATARGTGAGTTELQMINGINTNKIAITNGPAANRGTYVGTIRTNGSSQVDFIFGGSASGGTAALFMVWNAYNRLQVKTQVIDTVSSFSVSANTVTVFNSGGTGSGLNNRVSFISGLQSEFVYARFAGYAGPGAGNDASAGIGYDSTSARSGTGNSTGSVGVTGNVSGEYTTQPIGWHYMQALVANLGASTSTYYGNAGASTYLQSGLYAEIWS